MIYCNNTEAIMNENILYIKKLSATTLLVRLENTDIPYPLTGRCRIKLIEYLSNLLLIEEDIPNDYLVIDYDKLSLNEEDLKTVKNIFECFSIY